MSGNALGKDIINQKLTDDRMKTSLKISIVINMALLASLVVSLANKKRTSISSAPLAVSVNETPAPALLVDKPAVDQPVKAQPFRWSQLESSDYRTYINNLRNIGCPADTLRAIVTADVDEKYRKHSDDLQQYLANCDGLPWAEKLKAYDEHQRLVAEMQNLPQQEQEEVASLLGLKETLSRQVVSGESSDVTSGEKAASENDLDMASRSKVGPSSQIAIIAATENRGASSPQVSGNPNLAVTGLDRSSQPKPELPMIFKEVDPSILQLSDQQQQMVKELRQTFVDEIGGLNQDPNDPGYLQRWLKAQTDVDSLAKGMLGIMPWETYQVATWNSSPIGQ